MPVGLCARRSSTLRPGDAAPCASGEARSESSYNICRGHTLMRMPPEWNSAGHRRQLLTPRTPPVSARAERMRFELSCGHANRGITNEQSQEVVHRWNRGGARAAPRQDRQKPGGRGRYIERAGALSARVALSRRAGATRRRSTSTGRRDAGECRQGRRIRIRQCAGPTGGATRRVAVLICRRGHAEREEHLGENWRGGPFSPSGRWRLGAGQGEFGGPRPDDQSGS